MEKGGFVYILTNKYHNVLYVGSTDTLDRRHKEHIRKKDAGSFTARYNINKLVFYKWFPTLEEARLEEKELKVEVGQKN